MLPLSDNLKSLRQPRLGGYETFASLLTQAVCLHSYPHLVLSNLITATHSNLAMLHLPYSSSLTHTAYKGLTGGKMSNSTHRCCRAFISLENHMLPSFPLP